LIACLLPNRRFQGTRDFDGNWLMACFSIDWMNSAAKPPFRRAAARRLLAVQDGRVIAANPAACLDTAGRSERCSALRQQLKRGTAALHRRLEAQLGLIDPTLSLERYRRVLEIFYGFYSPVEASLVPLAAAGPPLAFPLRARSELIEHDLLAMGLSRPELAELPRCVVLPRLSCLEDLAGCLYVLEGACLGGQVIASLLCRRFGVVKGSGASFFVGDAEGTRARWMLVLAWLEGVMGAGARSEEIVAAACATFQTLAQWVQQQGASPPSAGGIPWST
jgi:heme oxygenase (biliverdin-IX-beta and delta-forming)